MNVRALALPTLAVVLVALVLGVQLASGGNDYLPSTPPPACSTAAPAIPNAADLDTLTQAVVIDGVRRAACHLGTTRERLLVALPSASERAKLAAEVGASNEEITESLRTGLLDAVKRIDAAGALPPVSSLLDDIVAQLGLPGIAGEAVKQIPASVVDELLPTGPVLERAIGTVDLQQLLDGLSDSKSLESALVPAIRDAAVAEARERLTARLQDAGGLFGLGG